MPIAVQSFLDEYDLSGKTIYLSVTHGGSRSAGIEQEIAAAIHQAMHHPDPRVRQRWHTLWPGGTEPSPAEFITALAMLTANDKTAFPA